VREARDEVKIVKVIESCTTLDQCEVARRLIHNWEMFYFKMNYALDRRVQVREDMILYQKRATNET